MGPFPKVAGNRKYLLVCTDYFTKWVEAEPLANIRDMDVKRFIWKNIITRFGVPNVLISDNGLQFDSKAFRKYCSDLGIKNRYSTPTYPQGNGQAEAVNKVIVNGLKKRLDDAKGRWVEKLPHMLWTYRTTPRKSTSETPFSMTHGGWKPCPGFRLLNLSRLWSSTGSMADLQLLRRPMGLLFTGGVSPPSFHYLLTLGLPSPLWIRLFSPGWRSWPRGTRRGLGRRGRKLGLGRPSSLPPPRLAFQELLEATLGLPLNAHVFRSVG